MNKIRKVREDFVLYTDGASKGNPGHSGIGFIIYNKAGDIIAKSSRYIGETTNNVAEYTALIDALQRAIDLNIDSVEIRMDSELVVKQLNREYRVRSNRLKPLYEKVRNLLNELSTFSVVKIPREENELTDRLASLAVKKYLGEIEENEEFPEVSDESKKKLEQPKKKRKWV